MIDLDLDFLFSGFMIGFFFLGLLAIIVGSLLWWIEK